MNDLILLAALMEGPQHGYALKKLAGFMAGHEDMHNNLVYPLLRRFVENSWVTKRTTGHERRRVGAFRLALLSFAGSRGAQVDRGNGSQSFQIKEARGPFVNNWRTT